MKLRIPYGLREMAIACADYHRHTLGQYVAAAVLSPVDAPPDAPPLNLPEKLTREDSVSITIPDALLPAVDGENEENAADRIRDCLIARVRRDWPAVKAHHDSNEHQYRCFKTMLELYPRPYCRAFFEERLARWPHLERFRKRFEPILIDYTPAHLRALTFQAAEAARAEPEVESTEEEEV